MPPTQEQIDAVKAANPGAEVTVEGESIVVSASADMAGSGALGGHKSDRARILEAAASGAVHLAMSEGWGVTNAPVILAYKAWARAVTLKEHFGENVAIPERPPTKAAWEAAQAARDATPGT